MQPDGAASTPDTSASTPAERYAALVEQLVASGEAAQSGKGFGSAGLKVNGRLFAMLVRDHLVLKLPRQRVQALISSGEGEHYDANKGRPMQEWLVLGDTSALDWLPLAREALHFVRSGTP